MISFDAGVAWFNYRVAGVCVVDDHVLLHRGVKDDWWSLPGGRCEAMESSRAALARELAEELAIEVEVQELLWVVENFYHNYGRDHHELGFYYRYDLPPDCPVLDRTRTHAGIEGANLELDFAWFATAAIEQMRVFPTFLRQGLARLPETTEHIIHFDEAA